MADWREEKWGACVVCVATIDAKSFAIRRRGFPSFLVLTFLESPLSIGHDLEDDGGKLIG